MKNHIHLRSGILSHLIHVLIVALTFPVLAGCTGQKKGDLPDTGSKVSTVTTNPAASDYNPLYWVEGISEKKHSDYELTDQTATSIIDDIYSKGWRGVCYWGADRDGAKMNYYFKSPFLETQEWAVFRRDGLTSLVSAAHKKGVKVMINIEGVNHLNNTNPSGHNLYLVLR